MLKKIIVLSLVSAALGAAVLGPSNVFTSLRASANLFQEELERAKPDLQQLAEIRVHLHDLDGRIHDYADRLAELQGRVDAAHRKSAEFKSAAGRERRYLERAQEHLARPDETFTVAGRTYTRATLNADALTRVNRCRELERQAGFFKDLAQKLTHSATQGKTILARAKTTRQQNTIKLRALEARLANAKLLQEVVALTDGVRTDPLGPRTELERKFERLSRKAASLERRAGNLHSDDAALVDWDGRETDQPDARDVLHSFLSNKPNR